MFYYLLSLFTSEML